MPRAPIKSWSSSTSPTTAELRAPRVPLTMDYLLLVIRRKLNGTTFTHGYSHATREAKPVYISHSSSKTGFCVNDITLKRYLSQPERRIQFKWQKGGS